jgi:hypothetical protein
MVTFTPRRSSSEITSALAGVRKSDTLLRFARDKRGDMSTIGMSTKETFASDVRVPSSGAYPTGVLLRFNSVKLDFPARKAREPISIPPNVKTLRAPSS